MPATRVSWPIMKREQQRYWSNGYMEYHNDPVLNRTYTHVRCVRDVVE